MKIVKPDYLVLCRDEKRGNIGMIEFAGRTCYKSEAASGKTDSFVRGLVKRGHLSVLEHGDMVFEVLDWRIYEFLSDTLRSLKDSGNNVPQLTMSKICNRCLISGNIRAWLELFGIGSWLGDYFKGHFDRVYLGDVPVDLKPSDKVRPIRYSDLKGYAEKKLHQRATVRFVIDRGISHEFVRHRLFSFSQESTRYCNYAQDRFGGEISCIRPFYLDEGTEGFEIWKAQCESAEKAYFDLLNYGLTPQEARAVLPTCVKTELVMTGTLGQWDHFFDMRAREKGGRVHPQALEVTRPLLEDFETLYPDVFG